MYRANDPRLRRRLNEIGQTLESANESAQSGIYIFGQHYVRPCLAGISSCVSSCVDASCPSLNLDPRERLRRQRGRTRGQAELNFDFYDDWDEEENDALLGWGGNDDMDHILSAGGGYGTVTQTQPARQLGMKYAGARKKGTMPPHDSDLDPNVIPGSGGFFGKLFRSKNLRYIPSAAGLQEHPGVRHSGGELTEGEALLRENGPKARERGRHRSGTASSGHTTDSLSSRGDIFPSDGEDDAIPLDDEFAMVLERRTTQSGSNEAGGSTAKSRDAAKKWGARPSNSSRRSTGHRTLSIRSRRSDSSTPQTPVTEQPSDGEDLELSPPSMAELKQEEHRIEQEEEDDVRRRREDAQRLAAERGLPTSQQDDFSSKEATPRTTSPILAPAHTLGEEP